LEQITTTIICRDAAQDLEEKKKVSLAMAEMTCTASGASSGWIRAGLVLHMIDKQCVAIANATCQIGVPLIAANGSMSSHV
jgi:hypothetical protein